MVKYVFADTAYFLALSSRRDQLHPQARVLRARHRKALLTTEWVLTEVAAALAAPSTRSQFTSLIAQLREQPEVRVVAADSDHFKQGCALYAERKDKRWSLTDCISFIVMREHGVDAALTSDEDFVQAGFKRLMDPSPRGVREPASPPYGGGNVIPAGTELACA
jgi:predicted nucleic acid-binding protein